MWWMGLVGGKGRAHELSALARFGARIAMPSHSAAKLAASLPSSRCVLELRCVAARAQVKGRWCHLVQRSVPFSGLLLCFELELTGWATHALALAHWFPPSASTGLQYKVLRQGDGAFHPKVGTSCECHYEGESTKRTCLSLGSPIKGSGWHHPPRIILTRVPDLAFPSARFCTLLESALVFRLARRQASFWTTRSSTRATPADPRPLSRPTR